MSSPSHFSTRISTSQLDSVELIEKTAIGNALNVEPIVNEAVKEDNPATIPRNSTIQITRIKLFLISAAFLIIGIGLGVLIGLENCPADNSSEVRGQEPAPQPTLHQSNVPTTVPPLTDTCRDSFKFPIMSNVFFVNTTRMEAECSISEVAPFMDLVLAALRLESISGDLMALLGLCVIVQLGGIPSAMNKDGNKYSFTGLGMWLTWIVLSILQFITTFISQLMGVLAAFSFVGQYESELETFQNGLGADLGAGIGAGVGAGLSGLFVMVTVISDVEYFLFYFHAL